MVHALDRAATVIDVGLIDGKKIVSNRPMYPSVCEAKMLILLRVNPTVILY
jgi:hypothetical protein